MGKGRGLNVCHELGADCSPWRRPSAVSGDFGGAMPQATSQEREGGMDWTARQSYVHP